MWLTRSMSTNQPNRMEREMATQELIVGSCRWIMHTEDVLFWYIDLYPRFIRSVLHSVTGHTQLRWNHGVLMLFSPLSSLFPTSPTRSLLSFPPRSFAHHFVLFTAEKPGTILEEYLLNGLRLAYSKWDFRVHCLHKNKKERITC